MRRIGRIDPGMESVGWFGREAGRDAVGPHYGTQNARGR